MSDAACSLTSIKDLATIATSLCAVVTLLVVFLKLRTEHPGYKLVLERELKLFDEVEALGRLLSPALTRTAATARFDITEIAKIRSEAKVLGSNIYANDELRTALFALNSFLRDLPQADSNSETAVALSTEQALVRWRECANAMRRRIARLTTIDAPYRLYTRDSKGHFSFVLSFATRRSRKDYESRNPLNTPGLEYVHWHDGEKTGLLKRY